MKRLVLLLLGLSFTIQSGFAASEYPQISPPSNLSSAQKIEYAANWLNYNTSEVNLQLKSVAVMPKSYDDTWKNYWSFLKDNNTTYQKYIQNNATDAKTERVMTHNGLDIYDGSVWSIALALAIQTEGVKPEQKYWYDQSIKQYKRVLSTGRSFVRNTDGTASGWSTYRAGFGADQWTGIPDETKPLCYNPNDCAKNNVTSTDNAYFIKFIAPLTSHLVDPLDGTSNNNWVEYGAVTGEQAWAALIGPIQTAYLLNGGSVGNKYWANDDWIDIAINTLPSLQMMQDSTSGGVYRDVVPNGVKPTDDPAKYFDISTENDQSLYAGLSMLKTALNARKNLPTGNASNTYTQAIANIDDMQEKLRKFFVNSIVTHSFDGEDYTFVSSSLNTHTDNWDATTFAVDTQTWGISVFLSDPKLRDAIVNSRDKYIFYKLWQSAINLSGYHDADGKLLGVGYTYQNPGDDYYQMSGEWTLGAINAAIDLIQYYSSLDDDKAKAIVDTVSAQAKDLMAGINSHIATTYEDEHGNELLGYLYANSRANIPFGWYSNAMPATASTAWALMLEKGYSPFILGGGDEARKQIAASIVSG